MNVNELAAEVDSEIAVLRQARSLLAGNSAGWGGRRLSTKPRKKRVMSAEARERIAAAQRNRWATQKKAAKK